MERRDASIEEIETYYETELKGKAVKVVALETKLHEQTVFLSAIAGFQKEMA